MGEQQNAAPREKELVKHAYQQNTKQTNALFSEPCQADHSIS